MNTFEARADAGAITVADDSLPIGATPAAGAVIAGIRPEHVVLGAPDATGLAAQVTLVESLGHERHIRVRLQNGAELVARQSASEAAPSTGDGVRLHAAPEHVHLFDTESGSRVDGAA
jgi:multiple sugar transport system ATP-binding protein